MNQAFDVTKLAGIAAVEAFKAAKEMISIHTKVRNAISGHFKPMVIANGNRLVMGVDADGKQVGFMVTESSPKISIRLLEKALAEAGHNPTEITEIIEMSKSDPSLTFKEF